MIIILSKRQSTQKPFLVPWEHTLSAPLTSQPCNLVLLLSSKQRFPTRHHSSFPASPWPRNCIFWAHISVTLPLTLPTSHSLSLGNLWGSHSLNYFMCECAWEQACVSVCVCVYWKKKHWEIQGTNKWCFVLSLSFTSSFFSVSHIFYQLLFPIDPQINFPSHFLVLNTALVEKRSPEPSCKASQTVVPMRSYISFIHSFPSILLPFFASVICISKKLRGKHGF